MNKGFKRVEAGRGIKKRADETFDQEQHFVLRLPPGPSMALKHDVESGAMNLKDKLFIDLNQDHRHGTVRYGGMIFNAKLHDLPTILETQKTTDNKSFYKTADICQILIANEDDDSQEDEDSPRKKDKEKKFQWNHGITPPMKNVRKRRFRRQLRKKYPDQPDIEKEVKRLFRTDNEAVSVRWEIVTEDDKPEKSGTVGEIGVMNAGETKERIDLDNIFGEISSSEDDEDDKDLNVMDSDADDDNTRDTTLLAGQDEDSKLDGQMTADMGNAEVQAKLKELSEQLLELREKRMVQETQIASIDNVALQNRFQEVLSEIIREEEEKSREYEILSAMFDQG